MKSLNTRFVMISFLCYIILLTVPCIIQCSSAEDTSESTKSVEIDDKNSYVASFVLPRMWWYSSNDNEPGRWSHSPKDSLGNVLTIHKILEYQIPVDFILENHVDTAIQGHIKMIEGIKILVPQKEFITSSGLKGFKFEYNGVLESTRNVIMYYFNTYNMLYEIPCFYPSYATKDKSEKFDNIMSSFRLEKIDPPKTESERQILNKIKYIVSSQTGVKSSKIDLSDDIVANLGADLIDLLEILMNLEEMFNVILPDEEVENIVTIAGWYEYLKVKLNK
jgi:acyl carrier protein